MRDWPIASCWTLANPAFSFSCLAPGTTEGNKNNDIENNYKTTRINIDIFKLTIEFLITSQK